MRSSRSVFSSLSWSYWDTTYATLLTSKYQARRGFIGLERRTPRAYTIIIAHRSLGRHHVFAKYSININKYILIFIDLQRWFPLYSPQVAQRYAVLRRHTGTLCISRQRIRNAFATPAGQDRPRGGC